MRDAIRGLVVAAVALSGLCGLAAAMDWKSADENRTAEVLRLLPTQDDLLINLDPSDLPSTSDMVRLGKRATPAIANGLVNNMSARVRWACAAVLTATRDPRALVALVDALDDPDDNVRYMALTALGSVESEAATAKIVELIGRPGLAPYVREAAVTALGRVGDGKAIEPLMRLFRREWDVAAQQALWDMRRRLSSKQLQQLVLAPIEALARNDESVSHDAVAFSVERAGDLQLKAAADPLMEIFHANTHLQNRIVYNLGRIGERDALDFLRKRWDRTGEARLLNNVTFALQRLGDDVAPKLTEAFEDRRAYIRFNAAFVAGDLGEKRLVGALSKALADANEVVQSEAAVALGKIGDVTAVPALQTALKSENEVVRGDAMLALARIDYPGWRQRVVEELLPSENNLVRGKAARFLTDRADVELVAPILATLDPHVYSDTALGLAYLGRFSTLDSPDVTAWLLRVAAMGRYGHEALVLLGRFADERSRFALRQWMTNPGGEQQQLLRALGRLKDSDSQALARAWFEQRDDAEAQLYSAFLLASIGDAEAGSHLIRVVEEGPSEMKRAAASLITELPSEVAQSLDPQLDAMLEHEDVYVRLYAARALTRHNNPKAFAMLHAELAKKVPFVRDEALDIVERSPPAYARPVLERWAKDGDALLRTEIERILERM